MFPAVIVLALAASLQAQNMTTSVTWEKICASPAPLPVIGHIATVPSDPGRPSCWSVGCETMDRGYGHFDKFRQFVPQTGVGYARLQSGWAKTEQKKGKYDFAWLDAHVDGLLEMGVRPWMCLCYGNNIYSNHGTDLDAKLFPDGPIMDAWLKYVAAVVKRYKGKVTMYEVWNEPDNNSALDSYDLYGNLFARTAKVVRENDPDALICAFGSCAPDREYIRLALKKIAELDAIKYMDCLTYHAYWPVPETVLPYALELRKDVAAYSSGIKVLQGETGCPAQLEYGHAMRRVEWTEYSQAKWDLRNMLQHWGSGIPYSVFTMVDLNYGWMIQSFGLVRNNLKGDPVYLRPKFHAVQHVTSLFNSELEPAEGVSVESGCGKDIACYGIRQGDRTVGCILWFGGKKPGDSLEREKTALRIHGLQVAAKDMVYVDMLDGTVHSIPEISDFNGAVHSDVTSFSELPLWDSPVVIIDRKCVSVK